LEQIKARHTNLFSTLKPSLYFSNLKIPLVNNLKLKNLPAQKAQMLLKNTRKKIFF